MIYAMFYPHNEKMNEDNTTILVFIIWFSAHWSTMNRKESKPNLLNLNVTPYRPRHTTYITGAVKT